MSNNTGGKIVTMRRNARPGDMNQILEYYGADGKLVKKVMELYTVSGSEGERYYATLDFPGEKFYTIERAEVFALEHMEPVPNPCLGCEALESEIKEFRKDTCGPHCPVDSLTAEIAAGLIESNAANSQPDREHTAKGKELIAKGATTCPLCNGSEIIGDACDHEDGKIYQDAECGYCGATWRYEYSVTNIFNVHHE